MMLFRNSVECKIWRDRMYNKNATELSADIHDAQKNYIRSRKKFMRVNYFNELLLLALDTQNYGLSEALIYHESIDSMYRDGSFMEMCLYRGMIGPLLQLCDKSRRVIKWLSKHRKLFKLVLKNGTSDEIIAIYTLFNLYDNEVADMLSTHKHLINKNTYVELCEYFNLEDSSKKIDFSKSQVLDLTQFVEKEPDDKKHTGLNDLDDVFNNTKYISNEMINNIPRPTSRRGRNVGSHYSDGYGRL